MAETGKKSKEAVMVVVRMRPFNTKETSENRGQCVNVDISSSQVAIQNPQKPDVPPKTFTFDAVFGENTIQKHFYEESCYNLVESVMDGFNGTIFAYGQTGCGKTWTMQGPPDPPEQRGVIPNSFEHIFQTITADQDKQFLVRCSYLEIYNEEIRDLLSKDTTKKLDLKEDPSRGVFVKGLKEEIVKNEHEINVVMERGFQHRTVGETLMNAGSSRSHSIFTVIVEVQETIDDRERIHAGKLNLVDLAGSERQSKTGATGERLLEGCKINLSLSALGNVISALVDGKGKHIPYRDSKLTRLLQDSLGGNTKTLMIAAISPADYNYDETLSTLRYANRAKNIKNQPKINEDPKDAMLREYKEEIERLRAMLEEQARQLLSGGGPSTDLPMPSTEPSESPTKPLEQSESTQQSSATPAEEDRVTDSLPPGMEDENEDAEASLPPGMEPAGHAGEEEEPPPGMAEPTVQTVEPVVEERVIEREKIVVKEVVPKDVEDQKKAMEEYNKSILAQRNQMGEALEQKDQDIKAKEEQHTALQDKLNKLKEQIMHGFGIRAKEEEKAETGLEVEIARKERERRRMQAKLRAKKRKEAKLEAERVQAEQEKKEAEEELKSAKEQAESVEKKQARYKKRMDRKLMEARNELEDLSNEAEREKETLMQTIRDQNREIKLLEQVMEMVLPVKEISKIWERSTWDDEREEWILPTIKPRKEYQSLNLPSLSGEPEEKHRKKEKKSKKKGEDDPLDRRSDPEMVRREKHRRRKKDGEGSDLSRPSTASRRRKDRPSSAPMRRDKVEAEAAQLMEGWGFNAPLSDAQAEGLAAERDRVSSRQGRRRPNSDVRDSGEERKSRPNSSRPARPGKPPLAPGRAEGET